MSTDSDTSTNEMLSDLQRIELLLRQGQLRKIFDCSKNDSWLPGYQYQVLVVHH